MSAASGLFDAREITGSARVVLPARGRGLLAALLACVALMAPVVSGGTARAASSCRGEDLLPELRSTDEATVHAIERQVSAMPFATGRLFKIEKPGLKPSYLFGTIHIADRRVTTLSRNVQGALDGARIAAFELPNPGTSEAELMQALGPKIERYLLAKDGERSDHLLSENEFKQLAKATESLGMPREAAREFKPAYLALALSQPACSAKDERPMLDAQLAARARKKGIEVVGLETDEEQLSVATAFTADEQRGILRSLLPVIERQEDILETTIRLYLRGENGFLAEWALHPKAVPGIVVEPPPPAFQAKLIDERNIRMRDRALPLLAKGGAFVAVGAAHLPGEKGLARLFQHSGFTVEGIE
jgi:hypothetical protein